VSQRSLRLLAPARAAGGAIADIRIAAANARFGLPIGRTPANGLSLSTLARLSAVIGTARIIAVDLTSLFAGHPLTPRAIKEGSGACMKTCRPMRISYASPIQAGTLRRAKTRFWPNDQWFGRRLNGDFFSA
jgi:hypothetical protein